MDKFNGQQIQCLWSYWSIPEFSRFVVGVLDKRVTGFQGDFTRHEFVAMAVERWFHSVLPQFNESERFHAVKALISSRRFIDHVVETGKYDEILGFYVSVFDDRWFGWTGGEYLIDLLSFEQIPELPQPHTWVTVLGVTPLYMRLVKDLETVECQSQPSEAPLPE
jgi:hypothetical protein